MQSEELNPQESVSLGGFVVSHLSFDDNYSGK